MLSRILFFRDFRIYTGGHGKVWDYFCHCLGSQHYQPYVHFTTRSVRNETNPWRGCPERCVKSWSVRDFDALFVAGLDWMQLAGLSLRPDMPVINLIQGMRHADPQQTPYQYLRRRAIRICVSQPVADAILETGVVNGPVLVIPAGLEMPSLAAGLPRSNAILVGALKQPNLGRVLADRLRMLGYEVCLLDTQLPKADYLARLAQARLALLLPFAQEGLYLPGLEAMALGTPVVMPDAIGNRAYARSGENCWLTSWDVEEMLAAVRGVGDVVRLASFVEQGRRTAQAHGIVTERKAFLRILNDLENGVLPWP